MSDLRPPDPTGIDAEIEVRPIGKTTFLLAAVTVASALASIGLYYWFSRQVERSETQPPAVRVDRGERLPPGPHLQAQPETELARLRARERELLEGWAWVDRDAGVARVPVEVAAESMLEAAAAATESAAAGGGSQ